MKNAGVRYLSDALMHKNCKHIKLYLCPTWLTDEGMGYLRETLNSGNCKRTIYIGGKELHYKI